MGTEARIHAFSRRQLLASGAFAGLASLARSSASFAQCVDEADGVMPAKWNLVQNGSNIARFSALDSLHQEMQVPAIDDLTGTNPASPLPGKRKPTFVQLRNSPNVGALTKWLERVQTRGALNAMRTLLLVARAADGTILKRYRLTNAFPADLTMKDVSGTSVEFAKLACGRVETNPDDDPLAEPPKNPDGPRLGLEIDGKEVASFFQFIGYSRELEPTDSIRSDKTEISWKDVPSKKKPIQLRFGKGWDFEEFVWVWHQLARIGTKETARKSGKLVQYGANDTVLATYLFENAWPPKFELSPRVTKAHRQTLYKAVTLVCDSIEQTS